MSTVAFDFNSIKNRIITNLQSKSSWADFLSYSTDVLLTEAITQELAYESQYHEFLTNENWWSKAKNKSSLLVEAPIHGFIPSRKQGSTGSLIVSTVSGFNATYPNDVFINKYDEFSNGNLSFCSIQNFTLSKTVTSGIFTAVQGKAKSSSFTAQGVQFESYIIQDSSVENNYYDLYVNNVLWTRVDTLFDYDGTSLVYEIQSDPSLTFITLKFGNGSFGKQLSAGDSVKFLYVSTDGINGNVSTINNITTVNSQVYDSFANAVTIFVTNLTSFLGGKDYPSLEEIRTLSPRVFQTGSRASSSTDYKTIISQLNFITKVNIWGVYEYNKDNNLDPWTFLPSEENVVNVAALDNGYVNLTDIEKTMVIDSVHISNDPTDILQFSQVVIISVIFNIIAKVKNTTFALADVKNSIISTLFNNYDITNIDFNTNIYSSDFISLIDSVNGVDHHISTIQILQLDFFANAYKVNSQLYQYPITGASLKIFVSDNGGTTYVLLATGDSNGVITGQLGYNTIGSSFNLVTGELLLIVNSGLSETYTNYTIKYIYSCSNLDLTLNQRYYIYSADLVDSSIQTTY